MASSAHRRWLVVPVVLVAVVGGALVVRPQRSVPVHPASELQPQLPEFDGGLTSGFVPWDLPVIDAGEVDDITFTD